jgi:hypothetical protein
MGTAPREQQRRRNAVAASSRRYQPRSTEALGDDPQLLLFGPSSPAARIDHLKPFDLRTVRMTDHPHCLQRSTQTTQGGPRRRLTERERDARNNALIARLRAPPTKAQILAELDLEISDAIDLALAANLRGVAHLLRMAKLEVDQVQRREFKDKAGD